METKWLASSLFRLAVFLVVSFNSTLTEAGQRRIFQTCWQTLLVSDGYPERILPFFELSTGSCSISSSSSSRKSSSSSSSSSSRVVVIVVVVVE